MLILSIPRMSCGGCSKTVEETVRVLDPQAQVGFNMKGRTASVVSSAESSPILAALARAGYPATVL